jgi:uroporphyrinogen decarboxylase
MESAIMIMNENLSSRQRVQKLLRDGLTDKMPIGELCINDGVVCGQYGCICSGFEERFAFIQSLRLDIVSLSPLYPTGLSRLPEVREYQWPDVHRWVNDTSLFTFAVLDGAFEWGMRILGLEEFCVMLRRSPLSLQELSNRVETLNQSLVERLADQGINGIILADDIAYQQGLFASPQMLRDTFIPSLARQAERILHADLPVFYHSDGNYMAVIEDIVAAGFNGLQCLEKSAGMDIHKIRAQFGKELCLWGHLEVEDIVQANDPKSFNEIIASTRNLASDGRFIMGTTSGLFEGIDIKTLQAIYKM